ncbi:MAG: (d)CMP kinase, partial [Enterobacterales bacterium]|nr:(d)CMP kinase [Enterobacterales bacterium]
AGKGTIAKAVAQQLGYHILDSGAIYRVMALAALKHNLHITQLDELVQLASHLDVVFEFTQDRSSTLLDGEDVSDKLREEATASKASELAVIPEIRAALLQRQKDFAELPGLVADGRDMGTVVFPDAPYKFFLTASAQERAERRRKQLQEQGLDVSIATLLKAIKERDERDRNRTVAPLLPADDAIEIDTTELNIDEVVKRVMKEIT